ncbi:MAG: hypothetical protein CMI54_04800 [Parcubacteria group bacterium]|nr:hypothetical protein [Parcubacteria group bacterium]
MLANHSQPFIAGFISICTEVIMFNRLIGFISFTVGVPALTMVLCAKADAADPFIGFGLDIEHHKNESNLCYSGGFSRNMTGVMKVEAGMESNDLRYYFFYKNRKCLINGDLRNEEEHWRADEVQTRDEMIGVSINWKTNF